MSKFGTILLMGALTITLATSAFAMGGNNSGSNDGGGSHGNNSSYTTMEDKSSKNNNNHSQSNYGMWNNGMDRWEDSSSHNSFKDIEESWASPFIEHMKSRNVIGGYPDGTFKPNKPVTRAEAVKMAMYELGAKDGEASLPFNDADQIPEWSMPVLQAALDNNIVRPDDSQTFDAEQPATRAWMAMIASRMLGGEAPELPIDSSNLPYKDVASIPSDYLWCVDYATKMDVFNGYTDGTFQPNKPITRAEMAAIMTKLDLMSNGEQVGTVSSIDETSITVGETTYNLSDNVFVYIDNQPAELSDIEPNLSIQIDLDADGNVMMIEAFTDTTTIDSTIEDTTNDSVVDHVYQ